MEKTFHVELWGSEPGTHDDCWTGDDFDTLDEAVRVFNDPWSHFGPSDRYSTEYFSLTNDDGTLVRERKNPEFDRKRLEREEAAFDRAWRQEIATQAGFAFGCAGYNDALGYDSEPSDEW